MAKTGPSMQAVLGKGSDQPVQTKIASAAPAAAQALGLTSGTALTTSIGSAQAPEPARAKALSLNQPSLGTTTDLIWHNPSTGLTVSWAMNGTAISSSTTLLQLPNWKITRTADLNGDGQQDLIWENSTTNQIVAWLMNGSQTLQSTVLLQNAGWKITHTADFNGDGKADLLFYNASTGQTVLWLMNGTTVLSSQILFTSPVWQVSLLADLNGDNKADLIWRNTQTDQTAAWLMNGTDVSSGATLLELANWRITQTGDLDGDGKDDLIWANASTGQTVLWLMNGLGVINSTVLFTHPQWRVIQLADLDGDGKQDLIWANAATKEEAGWLMNGASIKSQAFLARNWGWTLASVADLNGDGKQDLIWRHPSGEQTVAWVMNGLAAVSQTTLLNIPNWDAPAARVSQTRTVSISGALSGTGSDTRVSVSPSVGTVNITLDGKYVISGLKPGTYTVTPSDGFQDFNPPSRTIVVDAVNVSGQNFSAVPNGDGLSEADMQRADAAPDEFLTHDQIILPSGKTLAQYLATMSLSPNRVRPLAAENLTGDAAVERAIALMLRSATNYACKEGFAPCNPLTQKAATPTGWSYDSEPDFVEDGVTYQNPKQVRLAYVFGGRTIGKRTLPKFECKKAKLLLYGTDCSGLISLITTAAGISFDPGVDGYGRDRGISTKTQKVIGHWRIPPSWNVEFQEITDGNYKVGDIVFMKGHVGIAQTDGRNPNIISSMGRAPEENAPITDCFDNNLRKGVRCQDPAGS
jgi:cell wall-associated NlpC family hydrolase